MLCNSSKLSIVKNRKSVALFILYNLVAYCFAQQSPSGKKQLIEKPPAIDNQELNWFTSDQNISRAIEWLTVMKSADTLGIPANQFLIDDIRLKMVNRETLNPDVEKSLARQISNLILNFLKDLQEGNVKLSFDAVSAPRDSVYLDQLLHLPPDKPVAEMVRDLDCKDPDYITLKSYLIDSLHVNESLKTNKIRLAMNVRRYLSIHQQLEYILVNIPSAEAIYYHNGTVITMRTVVGKKKTPTPQMACYVTSVVTFPDWNVPYEIGARELLPKVQLNANYLEQNNFEIIDSKGDILEDSEINWKEYNPDNFPYYFRQMAGTDNALGVLKFNLQNPFDIFLHSTGTQSSFKRDFRFLSHGCIRLEKPVELANALLRGNINVEELKLARKNSQSKTLQLPVKIPVFILYMPVKVEGKKITFLPDIYGLIQQ